MATIGLRTMVVTRPGGAEGAPASVSPRVNAANALPELAHVVGYRPLLDRGRGEPTVRQEGPRGTEVPHGKEPTAVTELRNEYFEVACDKLEEMIEQHRNRSPEEFNRWVIDSGHSSDLELFTRFVAEKQGAGTFREINREALKEFMNTDRGMAAIYQMEFRDYEETGFADAVREALEPESPGPSVVGESTSRPPRHEIQGSGILRRAARIVDHWARTPSGRPGERGLNRDQVEGAARVGRFFIDTNGRVTATVTSGTLGAAVTGFVVGNIAAPGVGGIPGALIGALTALGTAGGFRLSRQGETMGMEVSPRELAYMLTRANGATIEWSRAMNGVNPFDLQFGPNGDVRVREGHVTTADVNDRDRTKRHEARALRIKKYQEHLGVTNEYQHVTNMQWLVDGSLVPPRPGTPFMKRVMEVFNPNGQRLQPGGAGIRDVNGNSYWIDAGLLGGPPGTVIPNPNYDPANLDIAGNIDRWRHAYDRVLREEITIVATDILHSKTDYRGRLLSKIDQKKKDRSGNIEQRKKDLKKNHDALTADEQYLGSGENGYGKRMGDFQTKSTALRSEIDTTLTSIRDAGGAMSTLEEANEQLSGLLTGAVAGPILIEGQSVESITGQLTALNGDINTEIGNYETRYVTPLLTRVDAARLALEGTPAAPPAPAIPGQREIVERMPAGTPAEIRAKQAAEARLAQLEQSLANLENQLMQAQTAYRQYAADVPNQAVFANRRQEIERQRDLVIQTQTKLREQQGKLDAIISPADTERSQAAEAMGNLSTSLQEITGWGYPGLTQADLATQPFDELMRRVTDAYTPGSPNGWPEGEQFDAENRQLLLNAMIEARALNVLPAVTPLFTTVTTGTGGIPEIDFLTLSPAEIAELSTNRGGTPPGTILTVAQATALKAEATQRATERQNAATAVHRDVQARLRRAKAEAARLEEQNGEVRTPELDFIRRVITRYGDIRDGIMANEDMPAFLRRLLSLDDITLPITTPPPPGSRYQGYERVAPAGGGSRLAVEVEIRRLIGDHVNDEKASFGTQRGQAASYALSQELIPTDVVRGDILVDGLNLGGTMPNPTGGPPPRIPIPTGNLQQAVQLMRYATGLDPVPVGFQLNRTLITPVEISRVLTQNLFEYLNGLVDRY